MTELKTSKILGAGGPRWPRFALPALAPGCRAPAEVVAEVVAIVDKGDTAWMLVSTMLVIVMTIPGLALFYGGLVRAKNMLSVLSQVLGRLLR